jgi:carnitine monooxygenase subunit
LSDIPTIGDYFTFDISTESIIIVRTGDGAEDVRAFFNVCQHRGNRLVMSEFGHAENFTCMFHFWAWEIDGTLKNIQDRETFRPEVI